jgi:hypothetical protein
MEDSRFAHCLQGGGVYVLTGTVTITSSSIYGNTAGYVRAHVQNFPSSRWENALLTCSIRLSPFYWDPIFCSTRDMCAFMFKSSHCPDGKVADALVRFVSRLHNCERFAFGQLQWVSAAETFQSSHRPDETHVLLVVCRVAVSMSILAQWPSHRPP